MEQYFYCKYGGIGPICSDCKRNPVNSPYKTCDIATWLNPSYIKTNGTGCTDYIPIKEPTMVNKQEFIEKAVEWVRNRDIHEKYLHHRTSLIDDYADALRKYLEE